MTTVVITPVWFLSCTDCGLDQHKVEDDEILERMRRFHSDGRCLEAREEKRSRPKASAQERRVPPRRAESLARWS